MFPSVLPDYKPALPANVGWEPFPFIAPSWVLRREIAVSTTDICDKVVLAGSAGVLLCPPWDGCRSSQAECRAWGALSPREL